MILSEYYNSPVFGRIRQATEAETELLKILAEVIPGSLFRALNQKLNTQGKCITISQLPTDT